MLEVILFKETSQGNLSSKNLIKQQSLVQNIE